MRAIVFALLVACTASTPGSGTPAGQFCEAAAGAPDCDAPERCEEHFEQGRVTHPKCSALYDQFATCLSSLRIACVNGPDFEIHATGDATPFDFFIQVMPTINVPLRSGCAVPLDWAESGRNDNRALCVDSFTDTLTEPRVDVRCCNHELWDHPASAVDRAPENARIESRI